MSIELKISPQIKNLKNISEKLDDIQKKSHKDKEKYQNLQKYRIQLLTSFGCNTSGNVQDCINFVTRNNYIIYNVGNSIIIREISFIDNDKDKLTSITHLSKQNNIFILQLSKYSKKITSMSVSSDKNIFILCEEIEENKNKYSTISLYYLGKLSVLNDKNIEPIRKIITDKYTNFKSCSLGIDEDYLCGICTEANTSKLKGVIYDLQVAKKFGLNETEPISIFDLELKPKNATNTNNSKKFISNINITKISYNKKIITTSGLNNLNFFYIYEGKAREIPHNVPKSKNFVDHSFINKDKKTSNENKDNKNQILYAVLTANNELYILQGIEKSLDKTSSLSMASSSTVKNSFSSNLYKNDQRIDRFIIRQYLTNIFDNKFSLSTKLKVINQNNYYNGLIIGNQDGDLLFLEKQDNLVLNLNSIYNKNLNIYHKIRIIHRKIASECTGICFNNDESILCAAFKNNEISYCDLKNSFDKIKNNDFELKFNILCEGYHHSPITSIDTSIQRNILIASSTKDSSVKIWNYITGLSEYCSLIFSEEIQENKQILKNFNILSMALHPSGYYLAMSNEEKIWFFFVCYRQLRFYGTEQINMANSNRNLKRNNCHILKFAYGGHILVAANMDNIVFIINSYSREVLNSFKFLFEGKINDIIFSEDDNFVYAICSNGNVYEINLIYGTNKLLIQQNNINYINSFFYFTEELIAGKNIKHYNILICGNDATNNNYSITELSYTLQLKKNDMDINLSHLTNINEKVTCIISVEPEKHESPCIVCGTVNGKIILIQSPVNKAEYKYDEIYIHKNKISKLIYIKETHLLFSCGEDGNIFMFSIQEIFGEATFYENQINHIAQINTFFDVGLGENTLLPLWEIDKIEKTKGKKHLIEKKFEEEKNKILEQNENEINNIIKEIKKKQNEEINKMYNEISELELGIEKQIEDHKDNYDYIINEMNKKQNGELFLYKEACSDYEKEINQIKDELNELDNMYDEEMDKIEKLYRVKFYDLRTNFERKSNLILKENEKIILNYAKEKEDKNCFITNLEVGSEIDQKNILIEQDKINEENKNNINKLNEEIKNLRQKKTELETILQDKEKDINDLQSKISYIKDVSTRIKRNNTQISLDKSELSDKIVELKKIMERKEITDKFSDNLRKELFKRNTEINNKYKEILNDYQNQKESNRLIERNINAVNTKVLLIEGDKEKAHIALDECKKENIKLKRKTLNINRLFSDVISKVYKSFQSKNKNDVYKCACEIYRLFLTDEYENTIKKNTLESNILSDFNLKINTLEKKINLDKNYIKLLRENQQKYKRTKLIENASLLAGCTNTKVKNVNLLKNIEDLSMELKTLEDNKNNSSQTPNSKKINKSTSAKEIFPVLNNNSTVKNKNSQTTENPLGNNSTVKNKNSQTTENLLNNNSTLKNKNSQTTENPLGNNSTLKNKISQISENSANEIIYD